MLIKFREQIDFAAIFPDTILNRLCKVGFGTMDLLNDQQFRDADFGWVHSDQLQVFIVQRDYCAVHISFLNILPHSKDEQ